MGQSSSSSTESYTHTYCCGLILHTVTANTDQVGVPLNPVAPAPLPAPLPAVAAPPPAANGPPQQENRSRIVARLMQRRAGTTIVNPCIDHGTWSSNRSWRSFTRRFLRDPDPVFLKANEQECPICFHYYFENDDIKPVRLPCNSQHVICIWCAINWFKGGTPDEEATNKCPSCRQVLFRNDGLRTYEMHRVEQDQIFQNLQVMRQTSAQIEEAVTAMWNRALMLHSDKTYTTA